MNTIVPVHLAERSYQIHIADGVLDRLGELLSARTEGRHVLVVTDENVGKHYASKVYESLTAAGFVVSTATLPPGEATKSLRFASQLFDQLVTLKADRRSVVVALGGGVIGDLAGFVAATYARGLAFVQAPTSLLAMVDASVGGKVAVDHPRAKNMIGAFHQPVLVACDAGCLKTLPGRQFRCGLAEVVKHGVIRDAELFKFCEANVEQINGRQTDAIGHLVAKSCRIKAAIVEQDERETTGLRATLNYGHTFAHALETAAGYEFLQHGEAVAIGMICAGLLAKDLGMVDEQFCGRQRALWNALGLPTKVPCELLRHDLIGIMQRDKKALAGNLRFILPTAIGKVQLIEDVDVSLVREVIVRASEL